jgi:hypothetical protein
LPHLLMPPERSVSPDAYRLGVNPRAYAPQTAHIVRWRLI